MSHFMQQRVLHALFLMSRDTRHISAATLARAARVTPTRAAEALVALERAGLVDASRARLTLRGLAVAVQSGAGRGGLGAAQRPAAQPDRKAQTALPWAAKGPPKSEAGQARSDAERAFPQPASL